MTTLTEADVEQATLEWLAALGWQIAYGPDIAPDAPDAERDDYGQVILERRLRDDLTRLNPGLPGSALDDALRSLNHPEGATLEARTRLPPDAGQRRDRLSQESGRHGHRGTGTSR